MNVAERDLWLVLAQSYAGRPTITLEEFLRDFMPMKRKTALNRISAGTFPVKVLHERILVRDVAHWLHIERTRAA